MGRTKDEATDPVPEELGTDSRGRKLYSLRTPSLTVWPAELALQSRNFVCLVVADGSAETTDELGEWARRALDQGLVYASAWGPGCEVIDDMVDCAFLALPDHETRPIVMTTWHSGETLAEAVSFFLEDARPAEDYVADGLSGLLVEVGAFGAESGARDLLLATLLT